MDIQELIKKHRRAGILIDTNLLLLLFVGLLDRSFIGGKRLEKYTPEHFEALCRIAENFSTIITTPHILTEVSNLGAQTFTSSKKYQNEFFMMLQLIKLSEDGLALDERMVNRQSVDVSLLSRFGLTDGAIAGLSGKESLLVLSDDFALVGSIQKRGGHAINFTHIWELIP